MYIYLRIIQMFLEQLYAERFQTFALGDVHYQIYSSSNKFASKLQKNEKTNE